MYINNRGIDGRRHFDKSKFTTHVKSNIMDLLSQDTKHMLFRTNMKQSV